jgi:hypothetical protein
VKTNTAKTQADIGPLGLCQKIAWLPLTATGQDFEMKRCAFITLGDARSSPWVTTRRRPHACSNRRANFGYLRQAWADIRAWLQLEQKASGRRELAGCLHDLGDLFLGKFTPGEQAGAMPPGLSYCPAQKHFGARAVQVGLVGERVCAR